MSILRVREQLNASITGYDVTGSCDWNMYSSGLYKAEFQTINSRDRAFLKLITTSPHMFRELHGIRDKEMVYS